MWIMLSDAFISIVNKDCEPGYLLVRARRPGDIHKVFGNRVKVTRSTDSDYLYRATVAKGALTMALHRLVNAITYENFKDSVEDPELHLAYLRVWNAMAMLQNPMPYSEPFKGKKGMKQ